MVRFVVHLGDDQIQLLDGLLRAIIDELQGVNQRLDELVQRERSG